MKKILIYATLAILIISTVSATDIKINVKGSFTKGEMISFSYSITSAEDEDIVYVASVDCPGALQALLVPVTASLDANKPFRGTYNFMRVDDTFEPGLCEAKVSIIDYYQQSASQSFRVVIEPSFPLFLKTCSDAACSDVKSVFVAGDTVYIDFDSSILPTVTASLKKPDNMKMQLTLPTSIAADQIGVYELKTTAVKKDYKKIEKSLEFAVISEKANIASESSCNANKVCDANENPQSCPQDCKKEKISISGKTIEATTPEKPKGFFANIIDFLKRIFGG